MVAETLESGIMGKWYRKHQKVELFENGIGNSGKMEDFLIETLESGII